ncbi:hypothetical protein GQ53DRAFT_765789 [Thozetella sp. PMI_491]|nr:hypothetical protein GQ53DRAFT_765789 [Thozetella sp. PMI_491]
MDIGFGDEPPNAIIYERDPRVVPTEREGYSLSLAGYDETGGLHAARDLGILDEVLRNAVPGLGDQFTFTIWDSSWSEIFSIKFKAACGLPTAGIWLARRSPRKVLIDAVGPDRITWSVACVAAKRLASGRVQVQHSGSGISDDQAVAECDLLVVADGYTGIMQKGGRAYFPNGGIACFLSPYDETSVAWSISYRLNAIEPPLNAQNEEDALAVLEDCRILGREFPEPFQAVLDATDPKDVARLPARDRLPFRHDLADGPVLFIGDSNHAVTPFSGYGASLALKDAWDLASQLCRATSLADAVKAYDACSMPRAPRILKESHRRINMSHATGLSYWFFRLEMRS